MPNEHLKCQIACSKVDQKSIKSRSKVDQKSIKSHPQVLFQGFNCTQFSDTT